MSYGYVNAELGQMVQFHQGDVYCPTCRSTDLEFTMDWDGLRWSCPRVLCPPITMDYDVLAMDWAWPDHGRPNAGCPWCHSCNIRVVIGDYYPPMPPAPGHASPSLWACGRSSCGQTWAGSYTRFLSLDGSKRDRWLIRVPTRLVPFTWIDDTGQPIAAWASAGASTHGENL